MKPPSPALAMSFVALVVALGGTGYAVTQLPKNSVGTKQLKNSAVNSAKIRDGAVSLADLDPAVRAKLGVPGPRGETGQRGEAGARGEQGAPGPTASFSISSGTNVSLASWSQNVLETTFVAPAAGRLIVSASIDVYQNNGGLQTATCQGAVFSVSTSALLDLSEETYGRTSGAAQDVQIPIVFGASLPSAGSYLVRVLCLTSSDATGVIFDRGDLVGIWTGA